MKPGCGVVVGVDAGRVEGGADEAEVVVLAQEGLRVVGADLDVVDALHIREVGVDAGVGEGAVLRDGLVLKVGRPEIGKWIAAGIVVVLRLCGRMGRS